MIGGVDTVRIVESATSGVTANAGCMIVLLRLNGGSDG
jgi:hypothetical protein